jgi:hypothetical protein
MIIFCIHFLMLFLNYELYIICSMYIHILCMYFDRFYSSYSSSDSFISSCDMSTFKHHDKP